MKLSLTTILEDLGIIEDNKKSGRMIAIKVPNESLKGLKLKVDPDRDDPEDDHHITLGLIENGENDQILKILQKMDFKPFICKVNGCDLFTPETTHKGTYVLYLKVNSPEVHKIHEKIMNTLPKFGIELKPDHDTGYKPHITMKYTLDEPKINKNIPQLEFEVKDIFLVDSKKYYRVGLDG